VTSKTTSVGPTSVPAATATAVVTGGEEVVQVTSTITKSSHLKTVTVTVAGPTVTVTVTAA
jgi:hypothetical protein